jgi:hypothetical protein
VQCSQEFSPVALPKKLASVAFLQPAFLFHSFLSNVLTSAGAGDWLVGGSELSGDVNDSEVYSCGAFVECVGGPYHASLFE